ncbi:PP2C family protein-serine/threonine phosphatase [Actinocrispum wychmicini]|uniref:Serine/threonine protein phosphatase PrpC n=1 Tax=Actinocrispum wychmicini TaxID=1213861 RepID=A0A4R2JKV7_9PSEU|nr:protein phosphatase 2C domain-containing protein [Actinocrispum wychmicini]TCO60673.1 serine/threonine protein phosphatase PrpC [Actinocrispum wychmicini]
MDATVSSGSVRAIGLTGRGLLRPDNQDSVLVFEWLSQAERPQPVEFRTPLAAPLVCAVADGMGGHPAGAVASLIALTHIATAYQDWTDVPSLESGLVGLNMSVYEAGCADPDTTGMGTTVAGLVLTPDRALCFNVGDSRAYQIIDGVVEQVSTDDGVLDERGMTTNRLTQAIGDPPHRPIDPHVVELPYQDGHTRFLLCSDGVSGVVEPEVLGKLCRPRRLDRVVSGLSDAAHEAGAPDNLSIVAVDVRLPLSR